MKQDVAKTGGRVKNGDLPKGCGRCPSIGLISEILKYICILNEDFSIAFISEGFAQELGYELGSIPLDNFLNLIEDGGGDVANSVSRIFRGEKSLSSKITYRMKDGSTRCTSIKIVRTRFDTKIKAFVYVDNNFELRYILERQRDERAKELKCLYLMSKEVEKAKTIEDLLLNVTGYINDGMQYPAITSTVITHDGREFARIRLSSPIVRSITEAIFVGGEKRGEISVNYHEDKDFLHEEYALVSSIAKVLGRAVERFELTSRQVEYTKGLEELVEERVRQLDSSERRFKTLFENAPSGIAITTENGKLIEANRAFYRMLKYPEDGSVRFDNVDKMYVDPSQRKKFFDILKRDGFIADYEFDLYAHDGEIITVNGSIIQHREDGEVYYESILKDITLRKKLEEELRQRKEELEETVRRRTEVLERQKNKLEKMNRNLKQAALDLRSSVSKLNALFSAITDPLISLDKDFNVMMSNRSLCDVGQKCYAVLFKRETPCKNCPAIKAIKKKKPASIEFDEENDHYQLQCYPIFDSEGNVESVLEWVKDITREKNLCSQMLQADRLASLGQLVSGIAHEINNPNTFIQGNMNIIHEAMNDILPIIDQHYEDNPDLKIARLKYPFFKEHIGLLMEDMVSGTNRITTIVKDLKKFARKGEEKRTEEIDVNELIKRSVRLVKNQVKRKARIALELQPDLPKVSASGIGLEQVLVNLIINASDAMADGEKGNIKVISGTDEGGENMVLKVVDDGSGMDAETQKQIFNPFFTTKRSRGGTGLGLSIAFRIIKEHDGEIEIESEPGVGTTFIIEIPLKKSGGEEAK